jgi:hypothetical protein
MRSSQLRAFAISPQLFTQDLSMRGNMSLVKASVADLKRMAPIGDHLIHALRIKNHSTATVDSDRVTECRFRHERVLVSNVNGFADKAALRPGRWNPLPKRAGPLHRRFQKLLSPIKGLFLSSTELRVDPSQTHFREQGPDQISADGKEMNMPVSVIFERLRLFCEALAIVIGFWVGRTLKVRRQWDDKS